MIIPVGHEGDQLRATPWVTFGIIIICTLVLLVESIRFNTDADVKEFELIAKIAELTDTRDDVLLPADVEILRALYLAQIAQEDYGDNNFDDYAVQYMDDYYNEPQVGDPSYERYKREQEAENYYRATPSDSNRNNDDPYRNRNKKPKRSAEDLQAEVDELIPQLRDVSGSLYSLRYGFVPKEGSILGLFTHIFLHADFWHLVGNMLFLYLFGPTLEDRYGRVFFGIFYVLGGMFAGFFYGIGNIQSAIPLVGASGAVFAVLGGYLRHHWRDKIRMVFIFGFRGRMFAMPAWAAVPFWFLKELLLGVFFSDISGVAHMAHVWGFVFGMGTIVLLGVSGLENRFWPALVDLNDGEESGPVRKALSLERQGQVSEALEVLRTASRENPKDQDLLQNYWRVAQEKGRIQDMLIAGQKLMHIDIDTGEAQMAHVRFREIVGSQPQAHFSPSLITRLCETLAQDRYYVEAENIIRHTCTNMVEPNPRLLFPLLEIAASMHCEYGLEIAEKLRASTGFTQWDETEALVNQIEEALRTGSTVQDSSLSVTQGGQSMELAEAFEFMNMGPAPKQVHSLKVFPAIPLSVSREGFALTVDGKPRQVPFNKIKLVAVGVIREEGQKPYLVIDLVFDRPQDVLAQHRVLRMCSNQFNPLTLLPKMDKPAAAFRRLVEITIKSSGADVAPSHEAAMGSPYQNYPTINKYERGIYYAD